MAMGKLSGGSERTEVPQAIEGVFIFSEGRCQMVAISAMLRIWDPETLRVSRFLKALFFLPNPGLLVDREFASERAKTPKALESSFRVFFVLLASRMETAKPG
jgi:hypothetical protein